METQGIEVGRDLLVVRLLQGEEEARACARIMAASDPWLTLGRGYDDSLAILRDPSRETYVALRDAEVIGFAILSMQGTFVGYVQSVWGARRLARPADRKPPHRLRRGADLS